MTNLTFTDVPRGGHDVLRRQLEAAGLPTDDFDEPGRIFFRLSYQDASIGYVGLEGFISLCPASAIYLVKDLA